MNFGFSPSQSSRFEQAIAKLSLRASFDEHLKHNNFRFVINAISDQIFSNVRDYVYQKHEDMGITIYKIPENGTEDTFTFKLMGNANYDGVAEQHYVEQGKIYTDPHIIASPYEAAHGKELLFRTSKGQIIKGDPFIPDIIQDFMNINSSYITQAFESDAVNFLTSNISRFR